VDVGGFTFGIFVITIELFGGVGFKMGNFVRSSLFIGIVLILVFIIEGLLVDLNNVGLVGLEKLEG